MMQNQKQKQKPQTKLTDIENRLVVARKGEGVGRKRKKAHYFYKYHFPIKEEFWIF